MSRPKSTPVCKPKQEKTGSTPGHRRATAARHRSTSDGAARTRARKQEKPGNSSPAAALDSSDSPLDLLAAIGATKKEADLLEGFIRSADAALAQEPTWEEINAVAELWKRRGGSGDEHWLRIHSAGRHEGERWRDTVRPQQVAKLRVLHEQERQLKKRLHQAVKRKRQPARANERVQDVYQVISELSAARADISLEEDYDRLKREHPDWLIFKAATKWTGLRDKIIALRERSGKLVGFAQEIVAVIHGVTKSTVAWDWRHKGTAEPYKARSPKAASGTPSN